MWAASNVGGGGSVGSPWLDLGVKCEQPTCMAAMGMNALVLNWDLSGTPPRLSLKSSLCLPHFLHQLCVGA